MDDSRPFQSHPKNPPKLSEWMANWRPRPDRLDPEDWGTHQFYVRAITAAVMEVIGDTNPEPPKVRGHYVGGVDR